MAKTRSFEIETIRSEFTANGYTNFVEADSEVIGLSNGGYAVVYSSINSGNWEVPLISFFDADDNSIGTFGSSYSIPYDRTIPVQNVDLAGAPEVVELDNGNVAVIWESDGLNDVVGSIFDPNTGALLDQEFVINSISSDGDPEAVTLNDGSGNWVVAMTNGFNIYLQMMDVNGNQVGIQFSAGTSGSDSDPAIAALNDGGFVVTYTANDGANDEIYARIYNADRSTRVADFVVGQFGENKESAVAVLRNGNIAVVYTDDGWSGDGLTLQIHDPNTGANLTPGSFIRIDTNVSAVEADPDITVLSNGFMVVSWTDPLLSGNILGRVFDQTGAPVEIGGSTDPFSINSSFLADTDASISQIIDGKFVSTWTDAAGDDVSGEVNEIYYSLSSDSAGDALRGTALRDVIEGNGGDDNIIGRQGNDEISGGSGNDTAQGNSGDDRVFGNAGDDFLYGGSGSDYMEGGTGNDFMKGQNSDDELRGGTGSDTMFGDSGNDRMLGNDGNDVMFGGTGNDDMFGGDGNDTMRGSDGDDLMEGNGGEDDMQGGNGDDTMFGGADNDTMYGQNGNDILNGGSGNDFLHGGADNDTLYGGTGQDTLRGAAGADTFVLELNSTNDTVVDFQDNVDTIAIDDDIYGGGLTAAQILSTFGTQVAPNHFRIDFGSDALDIFGANGAAVSASDLLNDLTIF